jgi:hypothetical protein
MSVAVVSQERQKLQQWDQLYGFTTENLGGYLPVRLNGRRALTVAGSGDHLINLALSGARQITTFDINIAALYWSELKNAAVCHLSREHFLQAFMRPGILLEQAIQMLASALTPAAADFFRAARRRYGATLRESPLFNNAHDVPAQKLSSNPYLATDESYLRAREGLQSAEILFLHASAYQLAQSERGEFDYILLSNIADYLARDNEALEKFVVEIVYPLHLRLSPGGLLGAAYLYTPEIHGGAPRCAIDVPHRRAKALRRFSVIESEFLSVSGIGLDRMVYVKKG